MSKVYKMNDFDWVYAENEEKAVKYYLELTDCFKEELEIKEVSIQNTIYYEVSKLPLEEQKKKKTMEYFAGELWR